MTQTAEPTDPVAVGSATPGPITGDPGGANGDQSPGSDDKIIGAAARRLARNHPYADLADVEELLRRALETTADATAHGYRLVLAERAVRSQLRADPRHEVRPEPSPKEQR